MSDAVWSTRRENKINTVEQLKKIKLTIAALQCAFDDYKESAFSVDEDSGRSKMKKKKKKKKDDDSSRGRSKHASSASEESSSGSETDSGDTSDE